jgi:hypothetical protein
MDKDQFKLLVIMLSIIIGLLFIIDINTSRGAELITDSNGNFQFVYTQPDNIEIIIDEPIKVEVQDNYNVYEDYLNDELREQQEDVDKFWEDDYKEYLRGWGVDENLMRGW